MPGDTVTYEEVFGASPGKEIQESHGMTWRGCPAVMSLRSLLGGYSDVFTPGMLGGMSGYWNEMNRHHAGLSVDIMLAPGNANLVKFGQNLFLLFMRMQSVMQWQGMIYQHVSVGPNNAPGEYRGGDHVDHIHIDWHQPQNVTWFSPISSIPWRRRSGVLEQLTPKQGSKIASVIRWTSQAQTNFRQNTSLTSELDELIRKHRNNELESLDLAVQASSLRN